MGLRGAYNSQLHRGIVAITKDMRLVHFAEHLFFVGQPSEIIPILDSFNRKKTAAKSIGSAIPARKQKQKVPLPKPETPATTSVSDRGHSYSALGPSFCPRPSKAPPNSSSGQPSQSTTACWGSRCSEAAATEAVEGTATTPCRGGPRNAHQSDTPPWLGAMESRRRCTCTAHLRGGGARGQLWCPGRGPCWSAFFRVLGATKPEHGNFVGQAGAGAPWKSCCNSNPSCWYLLGW